MLKKITIDGYKCLKSTGVTLKDGGLTVLLGPNGSGKSSIFGALSLADQLARVGVQEAFPGDRFERLVSKGDAAKAIRIAVETRDEPSLAWEIAVDRQATPYGVIEELRRGGEVVATRNRHKLKVGPEESNWLDSTKTFCSILPIPGHIDASVQADQWSGVARAIAGATGPVRLVSLNPTAVAKPTNVGAPLQEDGSGLPSQLNYLSSTRRKEFGEIEAKFREFFPWVEEIEVPAIGGLSGRIELVPRSQSDRSRAASSAEIKVHLGFRERGAGRAYPAGEMASGMLISLALLWLVLRPEPDVILCYDEPENSIHPYLLSQIYGLLRKASRGELGRPPVQVLVATHSIDFVNLCEPDEVRVCERDNDGVKITSVTDRKDLAEVVENYRGAMGELWNSGAIGGIPRVTKSSRSG